VMCIKMSHGH